MIKKCVCGASLFLCITVLMLLEGCQGNTPPESPAPVVAVEQPQIKKRVRKTPAPQSPLPEISAIGSQQGGARQGVNLALRSVVGTFAGKAGVAGATDGSAARARFDAPKGIASDGLFLYLTDFNNHTIRKIEIANGKVTTLAGLAGKKGSADGKGSAARFYRPFGITVDDGMLYVTDSNNHSVRQVEIESGEVTTIAGGAGLVGYADGSAKDARFFIPEGITTDGENLYVADTHNHSIRKINLDTHRVSTLAGLSGAPGMVDDAGGKARFSSPKGLTTDGRNLFVVDFGNHRIRKVVLATGQVSTLAGEDEGSARQGDESSFNYPSGVTTDGRNLYIADTFNRTVRKIVISSGKVSTIAGKAAVEGTTDGVGTAARFSEPVGITTDGNDLYVTDAASNTIRKIR